MRWKRKVRKEGEREIITRFLFLPLEINNEFRWLERVTYEVEYDYDYNYDLVPYFIRWIDEKDNKINLFSNRNNTIQSGRDINIKK